MKSIQVYIAQNIEKDTIANTNFRKVVATTEYMQLVLMSLEVGGEIGNEVHPRVDQFFRIEQGTAKAIVDGVESSLHADSIIIVPAGSVHNILNTGDTVLKLYTIYTPPNHIDGRVHTTKADADADTEDEEFGHKN